MIQGIARAFSFMNAKQLKEMIEELEKVRAEKLQAAPKPMELPGRPAPEGRPEAGQGPRRGGPPAPQNEEILKRLDRLSQEIDEIRKSLRK
jgi:hypothetical protein